MRKKPFLAQMIRTAMLIALAVVLDRFVPVMFTEAVKVTLTFVPVVIAASLYGPAGGAAVWGFSDLLGAILFPRGPYFPGFTATAALKGVIFGLALGGKKPKFFPHVLLSTLLANLAIGLALDTLWIAVLYGRETYWGYFITRIPQFAALTALQLCLIPLLTRLCERLKKQDGTNR